MSLLSSTYIKELPKRFLVSIWFGILSFLFFYLLPLFILDHILLSLSPALWGSVAISLTLFGAIGMHPRMDMDHLLIHSFTCMVLFGILFGLYTIMLVTLNRFSICSQAALAEFFLYFLLATALIVYSLCDLIHRTINRLFFYNLPDCRTLLCDLGGRIASSLYLPDLVEVLISESPERLRITRVGLMIMEEKRSRLYPENLRFGSHLWSESQLIDLLN